MAHVLAQEHPLRGLRLRVDTSHSRWVLATYEVDLEPRELLDCYRAGGGRAKLARAEICYAPKVSDVAAPLVAMTRVAQSFVQSP